MSHQHTLRDALAFEGVGLHTGVPARVRIVPQAADAGIRFALEGRPSFPATSDHVAETRRATVLGDGAGTVSTVEHVLAALFAMGVDNVLVEVDGPEMPVLDGSAGVYADAIAACGLVTQAPDRRIFALDRPVTFADGDAVLVAIPADAFRIRYAVDFAAPVGAQFLDETIDAATFRAGIAHARTFGYLHEVEALRAAGLARGGRLDNALVFAPDGPMTPLRWPNEVVRHKALDLIGDFALLGAWPGFEVIAVKSGHRLHAKAVSSLRDSVATARR